MTGIPCKHSVIAIYKNLERPEDYVHACYKNDVCVATYKKMITPLPDQDECVETNQPVPVALIVYKPPSRPPMKRKMSQTTHTNFLGHIDLQNVGFAIRRGIIQGGVRLE